MLELKQHIKIQSDNPLDAVIEDTNLKAYLVALFAKADGVEAALDQYGLSPAAIHAALAFYYDNEEAIQQRIAINEERIKTHGVSIQDKIAEMRQRVKDKSKED